MELSCVFVPCSMLRPTSCGTGGGLGAWNVDLYVAASSEVKYIIYLWVVQVMHILVRRTCEIRKFWSQTFEKLTITASPEAGTGILLAGSASSKPGHMKNLRDPQVLR